MEENVKLVYVQKTDKRYFKTDPIWQYDVGHVLDLHEFDTLPETFQVHFSHNPSGDAVTQIGQNGACSVPDSFVQVAKTIYAWIYVATVDTGLTKYFIEMPVARKSNPSDQEPEPVERSVIDQAVAALNAGVDRAEDAADAAETAQAGAEAAETGAIAAQQTAQAAARTAADKVTEAAAQADRAETAAQNAEGSATAAAGSATSAASFAQSATSASQAAAQSARATAQAGAEADRDAKAAAASAATAASEAANAAQSASQAEQTVQDASEQVDRAEQAAEDAETAKTGAETARTGAETAQSAAAGSAMAAAGSASAAQTSAGNAASSATAAAGSAQAAAQTAAQFEEDITSLKSDIEANREGLDELSGAFDEHEEYAENTYAKQDGYYADMTVGNAEQLNSSKFVENSEPYTLRTSGGSSDIGNREYLDAVVGGTLAWNQLVRDEASDNETDYADVVTVDDAVEDSAGVKVKIEPVQDLHGYDHPWPAGGGKNLFGFEKWLSDNGVEYTKSGNSYTFQAVQGLFSRPFVFSETDVNVTLSFESFSNGTSVNARMTLLDTSNSAKKTIYADGANVQTTGTASKVRMDWQASGTVTIKAPQIEFGSAATAYAPYENICPISGFDSVKVTRTGKNLLDNANPVYLNGYFNNATVLANNNNRILIVPCAPNTAYTFTYNRVAISGTQTARIVSFESLPTYGMDGTKMAVSVNESASATFTTGANDKYIGIHLGDIRSTDVSASVNASQLEIGSTATDYEPYAGNTYDIALPTEAGTVYGGTLDVSTGELVVDRVSAQLTGTAVSSSWYAADANRDSMGFYTEKAYWENYTGLPEPVDGGGVFDYCYAGAVYASNNWWAARFLFSNGSFNRFEMRIPKNVLTTPNTSGAKAYLNEHPLQVVYKIAPQTYTLTPTQIRTLLGTNNVWADTGDLSLTYTGTDEHLTLESGKKYLSRISGTDSMLLSSGQEITAAKGTDNVFDLTQMFGTAVADYVYGQGAAFFRKWFGKQWYPYNAGELLSVEGLQSHDMVGFNQWDEEWESGQFYGITSTGAINKAADGTRIRSKNDIAVLPDTTYYLKSNQPLFAYYLDENGTWLNIVGSNGTTLAKNSVFTTPADCMYIRFFTINTPAYKHDICISIAHNGSRKGEYAPYDKHSYPLDSSVILRGIPKVGANGVYWDGDRYLPDGTLERRYGIVDLGTLTWTRNLYDQTFYYFRSAFSEIAFGTSGELANMVCANYKTVRTGTAWLDTDKTITNFASNNLVLIRDDSFTDPAAFKAAMSGVYLVYELATPTTESANPYRELQIVDDWGTEEFVTTGLVPVGHTTQYPANLRDKLQHLPDLASSNGIYIVKQTDSEMELLKLPDMPTANGNYRLKLNVASGSPTFSWEVVT